MERKKYVVLRDRPDMFAPAYWNLVSHTSQDTEKIYNKKLKFAYGYFHGGRDRAFFLKREWDKNSHYIANKMFEDDNYFNNIKEQIQKRGAKVKNFLEDLGKMDFSSSEDTHLIELAIQIKEVWLFYDAASVSAWFVGGDEFKQKVQKEFQLSEEDFMFISTPAKKTAVVQLDHDFLKYVQQIREDNLELKFAAEELSIKYGWLPFGYDGPTYWDSRHFIKKLNSEFQKNDYEIKIKELRTQKSREKKRRKKIIEILSVRQKQLITKLNLLAIWNEDRKGLDFRLHFYYAKVLKEIGKRFDFPYKNLKYLFTEELKQVGKNRDKLLKVSDHRLGKSFMVEFKNGKGRILSNEMGQALLKEIEAETVSSQVKGVIASKGPHKTYQGKAKVLMSPKEDGKLEKGDFLVTTMTSPDFVSSMKKASGFITDEGGVTCHAAIVAREMNKPCIIATKIATKVFKDGDLVELDAEKGIVRKIKQ